MSLLKTHTRPIFTYTPFPNLDVNTYHNFTYTTKSKGEGNSVFYKDGKLNINGGKHYVVFQYSDKKYEEDKTDRSGRLMLSEMEFFRFKRELQIYLEVLSQIILQDGEEYTHNPDSKKLETNLNYGKYYFDSDCEEEDKIFFFEYRIGNVDFASIQIEATLSKDQYNNEEYDDSFRVGYPVFRMYINSDDKYTITDYYSFMFFAQRLIEFDFGSHCHNVLDMASVQAMNVFGSPKTSTTKGIPAKQPTRKTSLGKSLKGNNAKTERSSKQK